MEQIKQTKESFEKLKEAILQKYPDLQIEDSDTKDKTFYDIKEKKIYIYSRLSIKNRMFFLLHEAGHHEIRTKKNLNNKFYRASNGLHHASLTKRSRLDHLREEFHAWEIAFDLAEELQIDLDFGEMKCLLHSCLHNYIDWYKHPKKYETAIY